MMSIVGHACVSSVDVMAAMQIHTSIPSLDLLYQLHGVDPKANREHSEVKYAPFTQVRSLMMIPS